MRANSPPGQQGHTDTSQAITEHYQSHRLLSWPCVSQPHETCSHVVCTRHPRRVRRWRPRRGLHLPRRRSDRPSRGEFYVALTKGPPLPATLCGSDRSPSVQASEKPSLAASTARPPEAKGADSAGSGGACISLPSDEHPRRVRRWRDWRGLHLLHWRSDRPTRGERAALYAALVLLRM